MATSSCREDAAVHQAAVNLSWDNGTGDGAAVKIQEASPAPEEVGQPQSDDRGIVGATEGKEPRKIGQLQSEDDRMAFLQLLPFLASIWAASLMTNCLKMWPAVYSVSIEDHLSVSSHEIGLFLSVPPLMAGLAYLFGPSVQAKLGVHCVLAGTQVIIIACMFFAGLGYEMKSYAMMFASDCVLQPAICMTALSIMQLISDAVESRQYAKYAALGTAVRNAGYTVAHYVLPRMSVRVALWGFVGVAVLVGMLNMYGMWRGDALKQARTVVKQARSEASDVPKQAESAPKQAMSGSSGGTQSVTFCFASRCLGTCREICQDMKNKLSIANLRQFPSTYWIILLFFAFDSGFNSFSHFAPYAFQKVHKIPEGEANQMVGTCSIAVIIASPPSGYLFSHFPKSDGLLFITAALILIAAHLLGAIMFEEWTGYVEMSVHGLGLALLSAGAGGLVPWVLKKHPDLITSGFALQGIAGQVTFFIVMQIYFIVFIHADYWDGLDITPGEFFVVALGLLFLLLAIAFASIRRHGSEAQEI